MAQIRELTNRQFRKRILAENHLTYVDILFGTKVSDSYTTRIYDWKGNPTHRYKTVKSLVLHKYITLDSMKRSVWESFTKRDKIIYARQLQYMFEDHECIIN